MLTIITGPVKPAPLAIDQPGHRSLGINQDQLTLAGGGWYLLIDQHPTDRLVAAPLKAKAVTRLPGP